jgi:hypothetical protein
VRDQNRLAASVHLANMRGLIEPPNLPEVAGFSDV